MRVCIGIPTFNGEATLDRCLEAIRKAVAGDTKFIWEILIADNASQDKTPEIVRKFESVIPNLKYCRHVENIGAERNIEFILNESNADFVKLIGDDDFLDDNFVIRVEQILSDHPDLDLLLTGFRIDEFSQDKPMEVSAKNYNSNPSVLIECNAIYGHLASIFVRRDSFNNTSYASQNGNSVAFIWGVYELACTGNTVLDLNPYVSITLGGIRYQLKPEDAIQIPINALTQVNKFIQSSILQNEQDALIFKQIQRDSRLYLLGRLFYIVRYRDSSGFSILRTVFFELWRYPLFVFVIVPLLLIPSNFSKFLGRILKSFKH